MREPPVTVTIDRQCLINALDTVADGAAAIENNADRNVPLDHDQLIMTLRELIYDLTLEVEASDLLS